MQPLYYVIGVQVYRIKCNEQMMVFQHSSVTNSLNRHVITITIYFDQFQLLLLPNFTVPSTEGNVGIFLLRYAATLSFIYLFSIFYYLDPYVLHFHYITVDQEIFVQDEMCYIFTNSVSHENIIFLNSK